MNKLYSLIAITAALILNNIFVYAQTYTMQGGSKQAFTTCSGMVYDDGGASAYANNQSDTITFCSGSSLPLKFTFSGGSNIFDIDVPGDSLIFYDGSTATGKPIAILTWLDDNTQTTYSSQLQIATLSTCVTLVWKTNASGTDNGFAASVTCEAPPVCAGNPPAADIFGQATFICNLNGYCGTTSGYYGEDTPYNLIGGGNCPIPDDSIFGGTIENNSWLSFQADSTAASFNFNITNCGAGGTGLQLAVFAFDGSRFTLKSPCATTDGSQMSNTILTANGLTPGQIYYIMIDGNAGSTCDYTVSAKVGVAVVNAGKDTTICASSYNLNASPSGTGTWTLISGTGTIGNPGNSSTTVSGLSAGVNKFSWTASSTCGNAVDTVTITVGGGGSFANAGNDTSICYGETVQLLASGGTSYQWSPITGLSNPNISNPIALPQVTTTYTVQVTNGGCTDLASVKITLFPTIPVPSINISMDTLNCTTDPSYISYQWYNNATLVNGATKTFLVVTQDGNYNVKVTDINGCSIAVGINYIYTGLNDFTSGNAVEAYPNPTKGNLTIIGNGITINAVVTIYDLLGQACYLSAIKNSGMELNISHLPKGIYFIKVTDGGASRLGRFIKD